VKKLQLQISSQNQEFVQWINDQTEITEETLTEKLVDIKNFIADSSVKEAHRRSNEFQLPGSFEHWIASLDRIAGPSYIPSIQDVLLLRATTTGIVETSFDMNSSRFRLIDVGGQRSERRKWVHCFEGITAIIFCIAINEYNLNLFEDENVNRMHESLELFQGICKENFLKDVPILVFMNKSDLFKKKIQTVYMKVCFEEYTGGCNADNAIAFLKKKLQAIVGSSRQSYIHLTCATDTENIAFVFESCADIVLRSIVKDVLL